MVYIQVRSKLSTFGGFGGPTEVTCGGNALKFYASMRLNIKRIGLIKKGEEVNFRNPLTHFVFQTLTYLTSFSHDLSYVRDVCLTDHLN